MSAFTKIVKRRRALALAVGATTLAATGTGVAFAVSSSGPQEAVPPLAASAPASAVEANMSSHLGVLRRSQSAADAVPGSIPIVFSSASGANLALARHVLGQGSSEAWVVPGRGSTCILARAEDELGGAVCTSSTAAADGELNLQAASDKLSGAELLAGVVPDGVSSVTAMLANGTSESIPVRENVYAEVIHGAVVGVKAIGGGAALSIPAMSAEQAAAAGQ